jgi:hypothetical protein
MLQSLVSTARPLLPLFPLFAMSSFSQAAASHKFVMDAFCMRQVRSE